MIPYGHQNISTEDIAAVVDVLGSEWLTTGPAVDKFERDLETWTDGVPTVAVSSGTAALHAAYAAAGVGPGDEVITPPITFVATQATAVAIGAKIVFADVTSDTANINPDAVEALISARTRAIVAVDYAGHPADMDALRLIADRYGILLIEDAAHSLGSLYRGRAVGSLADITAFSFYPTKNITTAEGGAVATPDSHLLTRARRFGRQGVVREPEYLVNKDEGPWYQEVQEFGLNYRLPDLLAALGSSQLRRLGEFKARRAVIKTMYDSLLEDIEGITLPAQRGDVDPTWHLYPIRVPPDKRRAVFDYLRNAGIGVQVNYIPAYWHPAFDASEYPRGLCPEAESFYSQEISLPMHVELLDLQIERVADSVRSALKS